MKYEILYCKDCNIFTTKKTCNACSKSTKSTKPAKYSLEDKMGKYRRIAKSQKN
ncbi:MAG TPA: nucleolar RNA-binding Nop10p family protein [Candidatus Nanoarchaeia archaeon]|nr:nucleolar RNA-binding Nop10p family protein [Candidatus Nanoarchaeia archaeon]